MTHRGCYLAALSNLVESEMNRDSVLLWLLPLFHVRGPLPYLPSQRSHVLAGLWLDLPLGSHRRHRDPSPPSFRRTIR